ncbi:MAG: hypothetical protein SVV80_13550 [Planctomycetota bacterium]|nr:hypothetical protein [Planctomycetota bacterium]
MAEITWLEVKEKVLAAEPKAGPVLAIIEQYWGDGQLTKELAERFIQACLAGNYVEAQKLLYQKADADALIEADKTANAQLAQWVEQEKKVHNFLGALRGALIQIALGCALAMVGL